MSRSFTTSSQYGHILYQIPLGARSGKLIMPAEAAVKRPVPWVWYAPSFVPGLPGDRQAWYFTRLLAAGFAVAGMDVGESMGSPAGRELFSRFYDTIVPAFGLDPKACLLPQSRGGLMLYNWAVENTEKVHCLAGIYTVCNINSYPRLDKAAQAYGISPAQLLQEMERYNPIDRLRPLVEADIPVFHIHGDVDTVVPLETNSAELAKRYTALGGKARVKVVPGKGHEEVDEFFTDPDFLAFILSQGKNCPK